MVDVCLRTKYGSDLVLVFFFNSLVALQRLYTRLKTEGLRSKFLATCRILTEFSINAIKPAIILLRSLILGNEFNNIKLSLPLSREAVRAYSNIKFKCGHYYGHFIFSTGFGILLISEQKSGFILSSY